LTDFGPQDGGTPRAELTIDLGVPASKLRMRSEGEGRVRAREKGWDKIHEGCGRSTSL